MTVGKTPVGIRMVNTPQAPVPFRPGGGGMGCVQKPTMTPPGSQPPTLRDKTPIYAMAFVNCAASYWGAVGVQAAAETVFPLLSQLPVLQHMFTAEVSDAFNWTGIWDRFVDTMVFGMACTPFYGGLSAFNFLPTAEQKDAIRRRAPRMTEAAVSTWQGIRNRVSERFAKTFATRAPRFHRYTGRFVNKGVVGIVGMLREEDSSDVGWLRASQRWLASKPLSRASAAVGALVGKAMIAAKRGKGKTLDATDIDAAIRRAQQCASVGAWLCAKPESLLTFLGSVLPTQKASFTGLGTELTVSTAIGGVEAVLFGSPWHISTFAQSGVINGLTGFANVAVSQHEGFDQQTVWWERTKIGILKGSVYRGICTTKTVAGWFGYVLQAGYGLAAMAYANRITGAHLPSGEEAASLRSTLDAQIAGSLQLFADQA